jgi:hypothetical protein
VSGMPALFSILVEPGFFTSEPVGAAAVVQGR